MRWKHLFTAWKNAQNPIGLPRKNEAETAATSPEAQPRCYEYSVPHLEPCVNRFPGGTADSC